MANLKVALIQANNPENVSMTDFLNRSCSSLGILYLVSYGKKYFPEDVEFILTEELKEPPDLIGISSVTENFSYAKKFAFELKKKFPSVPIILGGPHISALPDSLPQEFTLAVLGEGEETFVEILQIFKEKGCFSNEDLKKIKGIAYHSEDEHIVINEPRPLILDIDEIPPPDRRLRPKTSVSHLITSRGCKFNCFFCSSPTIWKGYRSHSPDYVVKEIINLYNYNKNKYIIFFDDLFIADKKRISLISELLSSEGLLGELEFFAYGRTEFIDEEMIKILKKLNIVEISLGTQYNSSLDFPSGFLDGIKYHQKAIDLCCEYGIRIGCSFMIGMPQHREEDLKAIYEFIKKNRSKIYSLQISPLKPFPGTILWDYAKKSGLINEKSKDDIMCDNFGLFSEFDAEKYIYLNKNIDFKVFKTYCDDLKILLHNKTF